MLNEYTFLDSLKTPFAWPGGYALYYATKDGGAMHHSCAKAEKSRILHEFAFPCDPAWIPIETEVNWEDDHLYCDHCGEAIVPEYGDSED